MAVRRENHYFSGPLPPPQALQGYEAALPGSAERILKMAERQQEHRFQLETEDMRSWHAYQGRELRLSAILTGLGQVLGFLVILSIAGGGFWLILNDKSGWGFSLVITALASLLLAYLWGKSAGKKQEAEAE